MDSSPTGILAIIGVVVSVVTAVVGALNHSRIRSNCLGKKLEVSLDIDRTSPDELRIKIPARTPIDI